MENQAILGPQSNTRQLGLSEQNASQTSPTPSRSSSFAGNIPKRHVLAVFAFFGFFFAYALRANLSVAIIEMAKNSEDVKDSIDNLTNQSATRELKWSSVSQGYILSSFFYGYIFTQLPAGILTNRYGGSYFFGAGIGICAFLSLLIPLATRFGPGMVMFLRILQGLSQGFIFPSMHCMWSKWSPTNERSRLTTFALSGSYVGTVCTMCLGGVIGRVLNWESIFYIFGGASLIWSALWFTFIYESPSTHKSILLEERLFVEASITHHASTNIPWLQILRSAPVWAIICAHFAENWGFYTMLTDLPTFLSTQLNFKVDKAGFVSSLPYLTMAIILYSSGYISDYLIDKRKVHITSVRKGFCCIGLLLQCIFMLLLTLTENTTFIVFSVTIAVGFGGMAWSSFGCNQLDIGAGYANVIMSVSNFFATIPGIVSPILTGHIIASNTRSDWNIVFFTSSIIFLFGMLMFSILGSGDTQDWAIRQSNYNDIAGQENQTARHDTDNQKQH